jgi:argininosuccinate lyase
MKLWGGRFEKETDKLVEKITASLPEDYRLYKQDIAGSIAHVNMLAKCNIISREEADQIKEGLSEIYRELQSGSFDLSISDEDIHMAIERALIDKIGPVGGKVHTARSRNDQVALDIKMFLKEVLVEIIQNLEELMLTIMEKAEASTDIIMPGYTHLQRAQPIPFSHHMLAYFFMFERDFRRLKCCFKRTDVLPLGAAALAGTSFPIDREYVAKELGFSKVTENSLDAVSDRDYIIEFQAAAATLMVHLSRLAEEIVLWSTQEFSFIELNDSFTTGSSIMPQKKNPDVAELIRGKTGRVIANLVQVLTVVKGLPLSYNRDLQETKPGLFETADILNLCLAAMSGMLKSMQLKEEKMEKAAEAGFANATDIADYLVRKGIPFREAHQLVGEIVKFCLEKGCQFKDLSLEEFKQFHRSFDEDIWRVLDTRRSVEQRDCVGGTSLRRLREQLNIAKEKLKDCQAWLELHKSTK